MPQHPYGAAYWHKRAARQGDAKVAQRLGDLYASINATHWRGVMQEHGEDGAPHYAPVE